MKGICHRKGSKKGCWKLSEEGRKRYIVSFWSMNYDAWAKWLGLVLQTKYPTRVYILTLASSENIIVPKDLVETLGLPTDKMINTSIAKQKGSFIKSKQKVDMNHLGNTVSETLANRHIPNRLYVSPNSMFTICYRMVLYLS